MPDRILAIIVSFNPELPTLESLLQALVGQVDGAVVVDNASANSQQIESVINDFNNQTNSPEKHNVTLLAQTQNQGLGLAHNVGIDYAQKNDYTHVLILDQDSLPDTSMVQNLLLGLKQQEKSHKVSAVGATYKNLASSDSDQALSFFVRMGKLKFQRSYCSQCEKNSIIAADFLISSGSLISLDSIEEIGNMDEGLFIDHIDTEWFLRANSKGYTAFGICNALMEHSLGENTHQLKIGGRVRNIPQHKPFRYYYIFRNSVLLYKRGYCSAWWKWNDLQRLASIFLMYGVFCPPRLAHVKMMLLGIKDGVLGKTGEM